MFLTTFKSASGNLVLILTTMHQLRCYEHCFVCKLSSMYDTREHVLTNMRRQERLSTRCIYVLSMIRASSQLITEDTMTHTSYRHGCLVTLTSAQYIILFPR